VAAPEKPFKAWRLTWKLVAVPAVRVRDVGLRLREKSALGGGGVLFPVLPPDPHPVV
jgi:hypothetical protein